MAKLTAYAKLFWANRGNHNEYTSQKFLPEFTFARARDAAQAALKNGAFKSAYADLAPCNAGGGHQEVMAELKPRLLRPGFRAQVTAKNPQGAKDIIQASANNFYGGRQPGRPEGLQGEVRAQLAGGEERRRQPDRRGLPRGHARRLRASRTLCDFPEAGERISGEGAGGGRSAAGQGHRRAHPLSTRPASTQT